MALRPFSNRQRGHDIESLTARWLERQGLCTIARNHHIRGGETDLIMRDGDTLVFVEVRYRASTSHGSPLETITPAKQRKLIRAARFYLLDKRLSCPCRFDAVGVTGEPPEGLHFEWIKSAFDAF
ncbi:putative endonuclease [Kushneria avicenniae]|uniref:UPF0102 protein SAMN05421848_2815 n=1 Tax=Kushneria avicenniae TaxID=402385 RepID=A0A1I1M638_9GAMM|nr:YraN family protein [Kushneria avicenniae]SFC80844.1 putative endonuclease [Kushneria avicenniae]